MRLPEFTLFTLPQLEQWSLLEYHAFNIINRPAASEKMNMASWVQDGTEVIILDLWSCWNKPISVNEQLKLPPEKRIPIFEYIRQHIESGKPTDIISAVALGEGHSKKWLDKQKNKYYFIKEYIHNIEERVNAIDPDAHNNPPITSSKRL